MNKDLLIFGGIALGVVFVAYEAKTAVLKGAAAAAHKANPYSTDNVIYHDVIGGAGRAVTGDTNWTLGGWIYDLFHKPYDPNAAANAAGAFAPSGRFGQAPSGMADWSRLTGGFGS